MSQKIIVHDLSAAYDEGHLVLQNIDLAVEEGEILVVMGQSGCGKTTFLRHLMGLQKPKTGKIEIGDFDLTAMTASQYVRFCRRVGVLFQSGALFNSMTVRENVAFPLKEHTRLADPVIDIMVKMKLDQVGLRDTGQMMPSQLSGGMRKRAGLARALIMDPEVLLLDEPTTGLDPIIAAGIDDLILHIRDAIKATMVVVSHDIESGMRIADRIAIFHEGKLLELGAPEEIRHSGLPYVQQFLDRRADTVDRKSPLLASPLKS